MPRPRLWSVAVLAAASLAAAPADHAASPTATVSATPIAKPLTAKGARSTVTVKNVGRRRLTGLSLRPGTTKGVRVTVTGAKRGVRALGPLRAGRSVRVTVTVRRLRGGPASGGATIRLRRAGRTVATGRVAFGPLPKQAPAPAPAPTPAPAAETLTGRYYWGSQYTLNGIEQYTLLFTGPNLVFVGPAEGAYP